jgi:type IV pilus assembly protein PilW
MGGLSLIELMIAILIGLITSLAVVQVYSIWIKQSRTISSTTDSQSTAALAAYALEDDIKQAGQGFGTASSTTTGGAGCPITGAATVAGTNTAVALDPSGSGNLRLSAVQIIKGANGAPDQIVTLYGNSIYRIAPEIAIASTFSSTTVRNLTGFNDGDVVILASSDFSDCRIVEVTSNDPLVTGSNKVFNHDTTNYQMTRQTDGASITRTPVFNQAAGTTGITPFWAFDLGPEPKANQWRVSTTNPNTPQNPALQKFSVFPVDGAYPNPQAREVAEGVIHMRLQYGYDSDGNGLISANEWFDADATNAPDLGGSPVDWTKVLAIRYAVLARSRSYEGATVTTANPSWAGGNFTMTDIGGTADTNPSSTSNWRRYRYSVVEGVVPVRNALWGRNQ